MAVSTVVASDPEVIEAAFAAGGVEANGPKPQVYVEALSAGNHTIKLRAKVASLEGSTCKKSTRFLYLLIPDPEP